MFEEWTIVQICRKRRQRWPRWVWMTSNSEMCSGYLPAFYISATSPSRDDPAIPPLLRCFVSIIKCYFQRLLQFPQTKCVSKFTNAKIENFSSFMNFLDVFLEVQFGISVPPVLRAVAVWQAAIDSLVLWETDHRCRRNRQETAHTCSG